MPPLVRECVNRHTVFKLGVFMLTNNNFDSYLSSVIFLLNHHDVTIESLPNDDYSFLSSRLKKHDKFTTIMFTGSVSLFRYGTSYLTLRLSLLDYYDL